MLTQITFTAAELTMVRDALDVLQPDGMAAEGMRQALLKEVEYCLSLLPLS